MEKRLMIAIGIGGLVLAVCMPACAKTEIVLNEGFENGLGKWRTSTPELWTIEDGAGESGSRGLVFASDGTNGINGISIDLPAESGRIYSCSYRVKVESYKGRGYVYSILKWSGGSANGYTEGRPNYGRREVGKGWTEVSVRTSRTGVGTKRMRFVINPTEVGAQARFTVDHVVITASERRCVEHLHTSAYRDTAWDGSVRLVAECIVEPGDCPVGDLVPEISYVGTDGSEMKLSAHFADGLATADLDVGKLALGTHPLTLTLARKDGKVLDRTSIDFTRTEKIPDRRVWFDSRNRAIVDGRKFFPVGMYLGGHSSSGVVERYCQGPFNCAILSVKPEMISGPFDILERNGIRTFIASKGSTDEVRRVVADYKDRPGLFGWYTNDEKPLGMIGRQIALQSLHRALDPDHPTLTVLDKPEHVRAFLPSFDVVAVDPYPIGNSRGPIGISTTWQRACGEAIWYLKPMWQVPQAFNWGWWRSGPRRPDYRFPRTIECRSQAWQAIAAGANGVIWYTYDTDDYCNRNEPGGYAECIQHVKVAAEEVVRFSEVLLSEPGERAVSSSADLSVRTWRFRNDTWLLAVNTVTNALAASVALDRDLRAGMKAELGLPPKAVSEDGIDLELQPLDIVLLRIYGKSDCVGCEKRNIPDLED